MTAAPDGRIPRSAQEILEERARELASKSPMGDAVGEALEILEFQVGEQVLAVETKAVCGVVRAGTLSPIPGAPQVVVGMSLWRGELLAVVDPKVLLGSPGTTSLEDRGWLVVIGRDRARYALLTHGPRGIRRIPWDAGRAEGGGSDSNELVSGVTPDAVQVLDVEALMAMDL